METLKRILNSIDGKGYKAYKILQGKIFYKNNITLTVAHVQGDPFATPSVIQISVQNSFPLKYTDERHKRIATEDFIVRKVYARSKQLSQKMGTGKSGYIGIPKPSQAILERSSIKITEEHIYLNIFAGLPASGRRILGKKAIEIFENLFKLVDETLLAKNYKESNLENVIKLAENQKFIREKMKEMDIVSFVADGAILPRESGISDKPKKNGAVPFKSPQSMKISLKLPDGQTIHGMGVKAGITLIAGGGYHGKTTLLEAIHKGIYNHIAGDGREYVLTEETALKIRSEDGRSAKNVDISNFIRNLPGGIDTGYFSTSDASGSTSMAAAIAEAMEMRSKLLLIDEDTSATNFMIRDARMQKLIKDEPIIPLIDRLKELHEKFGISTILVIGGAGDYLDVCDKVIAMHSYIPEDSTENARKIVKEIPTKRVFIKAGTMKNVRNRMLDKNSISTSQNGKEKIKANGKTHLTVGKENIDLTFVEEIVEEGQVQAIGYAIKLIKTIRENNLYLLLKEVEQLIKEKGISSLFTGYAKPTLSEIRYFEIASALNRARSVQFK